LDVGFQELRETTAFLRTRQEDAANLGLKIFDYSEYKKANTINGYQEEEGFLKITYQPHLNLNDPLYLKEFAARVGYYRNFLDAYINIIGLESAIPIIKAAIDSLNEEYNLK